MRVMCAASSEAGPLAGVRILDLTRLLPGGYCTLLLADLGADVIKVEEPGRGDYVRSTPPLVGGVGAAHLALNRGKRSIALDLKSVAGVDALTRLVRSADALVESFRPGVMDRLGVGYGVLSAANPALVQVAITGYGQDGPYRDRAGHDIDYIAYGGVLSMTGPPREGSPVPPGVQVGDLGGGALGAVGLLSALVEARATGRGRFVDISMLDAVVSWLSVHLAGFLATGVEPAPGVAVLGQGLACYRIYRTGDGGHVAVGALEPKFWSALCAALGVPDLVAEQFGPPEHQERTAARLQAVFETASRDEWTDRLGHLDACVAPVNVLADVVRDPQVLHREMVAAAGGRPVGPGPAIKISGVRISRADAPAPALGEHTEHVLAEAGFSREEIDALRAAGGTP
jgi:crotonobetainyl-CoA:carnitine CoA-transferase CaiB-like acyl-CoA transferase